MLAMSLEMWLDHIKIVRIKGLRFKTWIGIRKVHSAIFRT